MGRPNTRLPASSENHPRNGEEIRSAHLIVENALAEVLELEVDGTQEKQVVRSVRTVAVDNLAERLRVLEPGGSAGAISENT